MENTQPPSPTADPVADQYERWIYPPPTDDLSRLDRTSIGSGFAALRDFYWLYWPDQPFRQDLDVLVAGCGTMAAAALAHFCPGNRVLGIDISSASLAHEQLLKDKYHLSNLELIKCPLEQVGSLGRDFDFIHSHGVLHHLADPVAGLRALQEVLRPQGVAALMVYGKYGRDGVYMFQEFFRLLGLQQRPQDVALVKETLARVHPKHQVQRYLKLAGDLDSDAGLVDIFLHKRDRAYSVPECLDLVRDAGLVFQGWDENGLYYPNAHLPADSPLFDHLEQLPPEQLWQAMELFFGNTPGHFFHVCHRQRAKGSYQIDFDGQEFLKYTPLLRLSQAIPPDPRQGRPATICRPPFPPINLDTAQVALISQVDGQRDIGQCTSLANLSGSEQAKIDCARRFFKSLWRLGYAMYRKPARAG